MGELMIDVGDEEETELEVEISEEEENPNIADQMDFTPTESVAEKASKRTAEEADNRTAEEKVQEYLESDEELKDYGAGVQNRINKLTYNWREAERREQAATEYAQGVIQELQTLRAQQQQQDGVFIDEYKGRVEAQLDSAKRQYKEAFETGDADLIADANQNIAKYASDLNQAQQTQARYNRNRPARPQQQQQQQYYQQPQQQQRQAPPPPDIRAEEWAKKNEWFGKDKVMTNAAMGIHQDLLSQGVTPDDANYYVQINSEMKKNFPHKYTTSGKKQSPTVTPGGNGVARKGAKKQVKLNASQVAIAKKLGVSLEEYARHI